MSRKPPAINTGAMADISFLLLTFFLLTSSISSDQGIMRMLPKLTPEDQKEQPQDLEVTVQNLAVVYVRNVGEGIDEVLITGTNWWGPDGVMTLSDAPGSNVRLSNPRFNYQGKIDKLHEYAKEFFANPNNDPALPLKMSEEIEGIGLYDVSQALISLKCANEVTYSTYIKVHNELSRAVNEIRDELSKEKFGKSLAELEENPDDKEKADAIKRAVPMNISESSKTK